VLISGLLVVKSKSAFRQWKTKSAKLYLRGNHYQWDLGEGKSFTLGFGISKVEFYANHPLSFMVHTNPFDSAAPVIYAAAMNENDYNRWMSALTRATSGEEYEVPDLETSPRRLEAAPGSLEAAYGSQRPSSSSFGLSSSESLHTGSSAEEREAADLERVLELSKQQL
jgi:hypothetical protein